MKALAAILLGLAPYRSTPAGETFACNARALTPVERTRYHQLTATLLSSMEEKQELRTGYAFRLAPSMWMPVAEWVSFERRCCPFFTFEISQARDQGPIWLRVTGSEGVKEFIKAEFQL